MKIPLMPKGVEHRCTPTEKTVKMLVRIPLMPKGVEHRKLGITIASGQKVRIPLMPKGVEHLNWSIGSNVSSLSENTSDAERR